MKIQSGVLMGMVGSMIIASLSLGGVVLDYRFETNNGVVPSDGQSITQLDDSGPSGYDGSSVSGVNTYSNNVVGALLGPGGMENAFSGDFDGTGSVEVGTNVDIVGTGSFTVEAFIRYAENYLPGNPPPMAIISNGYAGGKPGWLFMTDDTYGGGKIAFKLTDGISTYIAVDGRVEGQEDLLGGNTDWHHVAAVVDRSTDTMSVYIDYTLVGSTDISALNGISLDPGNSAAMRVGADVGNNHMWKGGLDEIRVSNEALTPAQFLHAIPEPRSVILWMCAMGILVPRLMRKRMQGGMGARG